MAGRSEKNTLVMMSATLVSRLLGILKSRVISIFFGAGTVADAINFAYNIPNNFRKLFAEGSLSSSYLPVFSESCNDDERTARLYRQLVSFLSVVFAVLFVFTLLCCEQIVLFLSDFDQDESIHIAASLLPFFTIFLFFISLSILVSSVLQTRRRFLASSIAPIFYTLSILLCVPLFGERIGHYAMALGVLAGSLAQFAVTWIAFRRLGIRFHFDFKFSSPDFKAVMARWLPSSISSLVAIAAQSATLYLASSLSEGSVSAFSYAIIFYQAPYGIFFSSISGVYFPLLSSAHDEKERAMVLSKAIGYLYTFLLPSAIVLFALSRECVATLLQKGAFTLEDTLVTASVLRWYLVAMVPMSIEAMLQRYLYSRNMYYRSLAASLVISALDIGATIFLIAQGFGVESLPMASVISSCAGTAILFLFVEDFPWGGIARSMARTTLACIPAFAMCLAYIAWNPQRYAAGSTLSNLLYTVSAGLVFMACVVAMYLICHVDFISQLRRKRS